jgi:acyl-CoA reductase-like NAD-dependent aldehyde dehydrogenase
VSTHSIETKSYSEQQFKPVIEMPSPADRFHLDIEVERVSAGAKEFAALSLDGRIELARSMQRGCLENAEQMVALSCKAKGIERGTPGEGAEWATGPWGIVRNLRLVIEQLTAIKKRGNTTIGRTSRTIDGNLAVRVFPANAIEALLFKGTTVDVHMQQGVTPEQLYVSRAKFYKYPDHNGRVAVVLGAGNLAMIPVMDVVAKMFNEGKVCILKMNPVNSYLGPIIEKAFSDAIERGFLSVVHGGAAEGSYLVRHQQVDEVHITGSDTAYDAIVWGAAGPDRELRKANKTPLVRKKITSELGNVSPVIITPGPYTEKELLYMARDIAGYFTMNASFLCCAAKIVVVSRGWEKRGLFLEILEDVLKAVPQRKAYYPGTGERFKNFTKNRADVRRFGESYDSTLPWTIVSGLDPDSDDPLFTEESFCPVLGETAVDGADVPDFLDKAVGFANTRLWGTLSATLVVHPKTAAKKTMSDAVERAIARLRYGTVCLNAFPGMSFAFASPPWGGYPGSTAEDIQSGQGWVHNTAMLEGVEKVVARFPFMTFPKPAYFPSHRTVRDLMRRMTFMEERQSWMNVPGIVLSAIRG